MGGILDFKQYKNNHIRIAKELCYGDEVIEQIKAASTTSQITRILNRARNNCKK
jgi:hypothetical protein